MYKTHLLKKKIRGLGNASEIKVTELGAQKEDRGSLAILLERKIAFTTSASGELTQVKEPDMHIHTHGHIIHLHKRTDDRQTQTERDETNWVNQIRSKQ